MQKHFPARKISKRWARSPARPERDPVPDTDGDLIYISRAAAQPDLPLGLDVPSWAKDPSIGNRLINARVETLADKPSWRTAFRKRRAVAG